MDITIHVPTVREALGLWKAAIILAVLALTLFWPDARPALAASNSITSPDTTGDVGFHTSLQLDASGNPVVSYADQFNGGLKLVHCDDPDCAGDESANITSPDLSGYVGFFPSLKLDTSGNPVVSYYDSNNEILRLLHCDDPNCAGDESSNIAFPDSTYLGGYYTSLQLDAFGNPIVSYLDLTNLNLRLLHCDDSNCAGDESANITSPDTASGVGYHTSLQLDAAGDPVVSYYDFTNGDLKLIHCDDPNCAGDESANTNSPDTAGDAGLYTSLQLDASGNPVISYYDQTNGDLKLLHCDDPNCAGDESGNTNSPDTTGNAGLYTSLQLDASGNPVISYYDTTNGALKVLHCDDPNCAGDESGDIFSPDVSNIVGKYTSLKLDASGNPVVSYYDQTNGDLKLLHCFLSTCDPGSSAIFINNTVTYALPKTCSDVLDASDVFLFSVCDNDFQGPPDTDSACNDGTDTFCNDEDPAVGSIRLTLTPGTFKVTPGTVPLNHIADASTETCTVDASSKCSVQLTYTTESKPWYPWDVAGAAGGPPDGIVDLANDILGVILHFCPLISDPCAKP